MLQFTGNEDSIGFTVRVVPRASKSEIVGEHDGALKVRIASPPVEGAANTELIRVLSKHFGVGKGDVEIVGGQSSKTKRMRIIGVTAEAVRNLKGGLPKEKSA